MTNDKNIYPELIDSVKLDQWLAMKRNVLFEGEHGVGKTSAIIAAFERAGFKWIYLSGATCDPYVDFVGIPRIIIENGHQKLKLVTREDLEEADVICIDEFNRAPKKVRNACMELIQFKSINGRIYPNLKCVWAAINPEDDQDTYDVEPLDPAQKDRFHIHCKIPYRPCENYFVSHFGDFVGMSAVKWWKELPSEINKIVSPRRMDYALIHWKEGGDIRDILHESTGVTKLLKMINSTPIEVRVADIYDKKSEAKAKELMEDDNDRTAALSIIRKDMNYRDWYIPFIPKEQLAKIISTDELILKSAVDNIDLSRYSGVADIISALVKTNGDPDVTKQIRKQFISSQGASNSDLFTKIFGEINDNAQYYSKKSPDGDKTVTFTEHLKTIYSDTNNLQMPTAVEKAKAWKKFINFIPESNDISEADALAAMKLIEAIASQTKRSGNFFLRYENAIGVVNTLMRTLYENCGYSTSELLNDCPNLKQDVSTLEWSAGDLEKYSILYTEDNKKKESKLVKLMDNDNTDSVKLKDDGSIDWDNYVKNEDLDGPYAQWESEPVPDEPTGPYNILSPSGLKSNEFIDKIFNNTNTKKYEDLLKKITPDLDLKNVDWDKLI